MQRPSRLIAKKYVGAAALFVVIGASVLPVRTAPTRGCHNVTGKGVWTLIPSPNDPLGRTMGPNSGAMRGSATTLITSLAPNPNGTISATSQDTWVVDEQDILVFSSSTTFAPIPGEPLGTVDDERTLTVIGGTGNYAGATGTIDVTGIGYNLFGPNAGPGSTFFDVRFEGSICTSN